MRYQVDCLGWPITAEADWLDDGVDIAVRGGCRTHVGAVSLAEPDGRLHTVSREGHRDADVSGRWASLLSSRWQVPVCVRCGIHYNSASAEDLRLILQACEILLVQLINGESPESGDL